MTTTANIQVILTERRTPLSKRCYKPDNAENDYEKVLVVDTTAAI